MAEKSVPGKKRSGVSKVGRAAYLATDSVMDFIASVIRTILKFSGSVLIVLLLSGMLFACIFAYYVQSCLSSEFDVSLEDYRINQSSTI